MHVGLSGALWRRGAQVSTAPAPQRPDAPAMLPLDRQNEYRERYRALKPGWRPSGEIYEATVRAHLPSNGRLLDLGCGRGGLPEKLVAEGCTVFGTDPDMRSLREYRTPSVRRALAQSSRQPFPTASFSLIISSWVLEHLPDPASTLREAARLLQSGGVLVALTPNVCHPLLFANRITRWAPALQRRLVRDLYGRGGADTFPVRYRANSPVRLRALARENGLALTQLALIEDPSYIAVNSRLFRLAATLERKLPASLRVHMVAVFEK
ncbi:MAG: class I SAM-dependent methyltransferase [Anaerolineales bacterium]